MNKIVFAALLSASLLQCVDARADDNTAATSGFTADSNGLPTAASTTFYLPLWTDGDAIRTTHHELLHAIGFTVQYANFNLHVNDQRYFCDTPTDPCTILAKLTAGPQTHIDPNAGVVDGFDQAKSVMGPMRVAGQRMDGQEKAVLDSAFNWSSHNIKIVISYVGSFDDTQKSYVQNAVDSAATLFGSNGTGSAFIWTVQTAASPAQANLVSASSQTPSKTLVETLKLSQPAQQTAISAAILQRGYAALGDLKAAGAKPMTGINPPRPDVLYSLITKQIEGRIHTTSFGLHVTAGTTRQDVVAMGQRWGFTLPDSSHFDPASSPACYVILTQGKELLDTMENLIKSESAVTSVNFNYFE